MMQQRLNLNLKAFGRLHVLECSNTQTIDDLKLKICDEELGIPPHEQHLIAGGRELPPGSLLDANLRNDDTIHLQLRLSGGGPGLAFLAKKTWHTSRLDNVERVWQAEEKEKQEAQKILEKQRQLAEERQIGELKHAARAAGLQVSTRERLDWMYEGAVKSGPTVEDYAMGKAKPEDNETTQLDKVRDSHGPGANFTTSTDAFLDQESKIRNDPMLAIKRKEEEAFNEVAKNSFVMTKIRSDAKSIRKEKKLDKKLKKAMKKSAKKEKKAHKHDRPDAGPPQRGRSPERRVNPVLDRRRSPERRQRSPDRRQRSPDRRRSPERRQRSRSRSPPKAEAGGLQVMKKAKTDSLGPRSLMDWEKHHNEKRRETEAQRKATSGGPQDEKRASGYGQRMGKSGNMSSASSGYTAKMSEEEKAKRLAAMKGSAAAHTKAVAVTAALNQRDKEAEEAELLKNKSAGFIDKLGENAYGMDHEMGMEETNRRKAYTRQKGNRDEQAFLKR